MYVIAYIHAFRTALSCGRRCAGREDRTHQRLIIIIYLVHSPGIYLFIYLFIRAVLVAYPIKLTRRETFLKRNKRLLLKDLSFLFHSPRQNIGPCPPRPKDIDGLLLSPFLLKRAGLTCPGKMVQVKPSISVIGLVGWLYVGPLGRSQGGGARGQNLELPYFPWFSDFALYLDTQLVYFLTSFRL